jgi:hypothetical protein
LVHYLGCRKNCHFVGWWTTIEELIMLGKKWHSDNMVYSPKVKEFGVDDKFSRYGRGGFTVQNND